MKVFFIKISIYGLNENAEFNGFVAYKVVKTLIYYSNDQTFLYWIQNRFKVTLVWTVVFRSIFDCCVHENKPLFLRNIPWPRKRVFIIDKVILCINYMAAWQYWDIIYVLIYRYGYTEQTKYKSVIVNIYMILHTKIKMFWYLARRIAHIILSL